jgi:predicted acetyltransferase
MVLTPGGRPTGDAAPSGGIHPPGSPLGGAPRPPGPEPEIRALTPDDDLDAQLDLAERSFGAKGGDERDRWREAMSGHIAEGRCLGAFVGGRPAGGAVYHDMRQWWCGRQVPMAGVSSVRVAPEDRGRGIGRRLMTALLDQIAARGYPLSALFPATMPLYRSLGWELAGGRHTAVIPARSLFRLIPSDPALPDLDPDPQPGPALRRATPGDAAAIISVIGRVHEAARDSGPITWDVTAISRWIAEPDVYAYLCDDGFLAYRWHNGNEDLYVDGAEAISSQTVRAFWAHVGSHASIAERVYARVGPADAFWWLGRERDAGVEHRSMWMLRVVDVATAIAARGFPEAVSLRVPLHITDDARPANSGLWELAVADGRGTLTEPGCALRRGALNLGARGLAALYAGTPLVTLRQAGLAHGGTPDGDAALDAGFAATPYMLDSF